MKPTEWPPWIPDLLYRLALQSEQIQSSRHAACIVWKNRLLSVGQAKIKTHPLQAKFASNSKRIYLHAEIDVIVRCINNHGTDILKESDLYILRLSKGGAVSMSKPCSGCQRAIEAFQLKSVNWTH